MSNATENRNSAGDGTGTNHPPLFYDGLVDAAVEIFAGTLVGALLSDTDRPLRPMPANGDSSCEIRGVSTAHVDNSSGSKGDKRARVRTGTALLEAYVTHPPTIADLWHPVYAVNDHTISNTSGDGQCVGVLVGLDRNTGKPVAWIDPWIAAIFNGGYLASGAVLSASLAVGALSADVHGRAVMATGYFSAAKALDAFAANAIVESSLALTIRGEQALSGAGAVDVTHRTTKLTSTGGAQAITIADGTIASQRKTIVHDVDGGSMVLTPATPLHFATYTFTAVHDWLELEWTGAAWIIVAYGGGSIA